MTLDESKTDEDNLNEEHGVRLVVDKKVAPYLEGAIVNFIESGYDAGFEIRSPNFGNSCSDGCGGSC